MDERAELVGRIEQAALEGLISSVDRDIRINNVRNAGSEAELDLIRRDLDRLQASSAVPQVSITDGPRYVPPRPTRQADREPRWWPVPVLLALIFVIAVMITWAYRGMRGVMEVGGSCASGGPYEIAVPCPDGTWTLAVAIPVVILAGLIGAFLAVVVRAPSPLLVLWGGLFGALGWNFLDFARSESEPSLYVVGVVFWLMAAPAVLLLPALAVPRSSLRGLMTGPLEGSALPVPEWAWLISYAIVGALGVWLGWAWWEQVT